MTSTTSGHDGEGVGLKRHQRLIDSVKSQPHLQIVAVLVKIRSSPSARSPSKHQQVRRLTGATSCFHGIAPTVSLPPTSPLRSPSHQLRWLYVASNRNSLAGQTSGPRDYIQPKLVGRYGRVRLTFLSSLTVSHVCVSLVYLHS